VTTLNDAAAKTSSAFVIRMRIALIKISFLA
jgi:hypothetical protein